jgi:O-antigen/teichoic acid export membrane protein
MSTDLAASTPPPPRQGRTDDTQKAVRGSLWTLCGYGGSQVLRLTSNLILARFLFPEAFGLMALVKVFMHGLQMFSDLGIGPSIIQNKAGTQPAFLRAAWTIQVLRGLALGALTTLLAVPVSRFFAVNDPMAVQLAYLLPVVGITAVIGGFASTSVFTLNRKMQIGRVTMMELIPQAFSLTVMIVWAWIAPSVWALVAGGITHSLVRTLLSHLWNPGPRDRFGWDRHAAAELIRFGRWIFLSTVVTFLATHIDRILLGRMLSLAELGLYSIGMTFARVATHTTSRLSSVVLFPLLAKRRDDPHGMIRSCLKARFAVLAAGGAVCLAFAIFAPTFFGLLYTEAYAAAGPISRWLALYVWFHILLISMNRIPLALGTPHILFVSNCITTCAMSLAVIGYHFAQLPGFVVGMALADLLAHAYLINRLPTGRWAMLKQGTMGTVLALAYALPAFWLAERAAGTTWWQEVSVVGALSALPCVVAAGLVYRHVKMNRKGNP